MKIGIVGCGLIAHKRAQCLKEHTLVACADPVLERAQALAAKYPGCEVLQDWSKLIARADIEVVIVAAIHAALAEITLAAVRAGKHVLVEKPAARCSEELIPVMKAAEAMKVCVHVGFNHRYHRALQKAKSLIQEGLLGELMFIRGRYGHGARIGYDKEWRASKNLAGGGELIDQGVHLIDLSRWFLGEFSECQGVAHTYFWDMPVEDNGFLLLKTKAKQVAFLHASCTEWKNTFAFEIYGKEAKLEINGLGGSYGVERIAFYQMLPQMGPPETTIWEYPMADNSWEIEFEEFINDIHLQRSSSASLQDAYAALKIVEQVYEVCEHDYCT